MNRRQWQVLAVGAVATVLAPTLCTVWLCPPILGPLVEDLPGHYSQAMTSAVAPKWTLPVAVGLVGLTGLAVYKSRSQGAA